MIMGSRMIMLIFMSMFAFMLGSILTDSAKNKNKNKLDKIAEVTAFLRENVGNGVDSVNATLSSGDVASLASDIFNVKCFWITGFDVYDVSSIQNEFG